MTHPNNFWSHNLKERGEGRGGGKGDSEQGLRKKRRGGGRGVDTW